MDQKPLHKVYISVHYMYRYHFKGAQMDEYQFPLLDVPASAIDAHQKLIHALGTETVPDQWMVFMETVTRLLPDVLSSGRPSKEAIAQSPIGQLGFSGWKAMIEAPADIGGLGWNWSAWRAWRRAWTVVQAYPWLRAEPMTASEIYTLSQECKRDGASFPSSSVELKAFRAASIAAAEQRKAATAQAQRERADKAEAQAAELRTQLAVATGRATALAEQLAASEARAQELAREAGQHAQAIEQLKKDMAQEIARQVGQHAQEIEQLKKDLAEARKPKPKPAQRTRWQHFLAFLKGQ